LNTASMERVSVTTAVTRYQVGTCSSAPCRQRDDCPEAQHDDGATQAPLLEHRHQAHRRGHRRRLGAGCTRATSTSWESLGWSHRSPQGQTFILVDCKEQIWECHWLAIRTTYEDHPSSVRSFRVCLAPAKHSPANHEVCHSRSCPRMAN